MNCPPGQKKVAVVERRPLMATIVLKIATEQTGTL